MMSCRNNPVPLEVTIPFDKGVNMTCSRCRNPSPELQFVECGCKMHAMCVPTSTICAENGEAKSRGKTKCPNCGKSASKGIYLYPIDIHPLERIILSKAPNNVNNQVISNVDCNGNVINNNDRSAMLEELYASIAPLFHLTWASKNTERRAISISSESSAIVSPSYKYHAPTSTFTEDDISFRNGRWSPEEVEFVDLAMKSFDEGDLPISNGITLDDFLRSLLLCKSTRLRKKIKKANFCTRTYCPRVNATEGDSDNKIPSHSNTAYDTIPFPPMNDLTMKLADQQQKFVSSIVDDTATINDINSTAGTSASYSYDQQLLKFSLSRTWSMLFWKFCSEVGYTNLLSDDWWKSIEEIEEKAVAAKSKMKRELRRMKVDINSNNWRIGGQVADVVDIQSQIESKSTGTTVTSSVPTKRSPSIPDEMVHSGNSSLSSPLTVVHDYSNNIIKQQHHHHKEKQPPTANEGDVPLHLQSKRARLANDILAEPPESINDVNDMCDQLSDWNPFIEKVTQFVVEEHLPFEYFDIWITDQKDTNANAGENEDDRFQGVPYQSPTVNQDNNVSLRHVGHATNPETDCIFTMYHMNEFGRYSSTFMFTPGIGLPGRVYNAGQPTWDESVQDATLDDFPRVPGARSHGVKKALGIPLEGRTEGEIIVVALYSASKITKDESLVEKCYIEFQRYRPSAKWELVLDIGNPDYNEFDQEFKHEDDEIDLFENTNYLASTDAEEEAMVNILAQYAPIEDGSNLLTSNLPESFASLRLLLLRASSRRSDEETGVIETLKRSYRFYLQSGREEKEIAMLLANDWIVLRSDLHCQPKKPVHPIAVNMTSVNYADITRVCSTSPPALLQ